MNGEMSRILVYGTVFIIVAGLLAYRVRRLTQARPLNPARLWTIPAILIVASLVSLERSALSTSEWALLFGCLIVGGALGWLRAKTIRLSVDPATGALMAQASAAAIVFLFALLFARVGLRAVLTSNRQALGFSVAAVDGAFLVFAAGLFTARAIELGIRARTVARLGSAERSPSSESQS